MAPWSQWIAIGTLELRDRSMMPVIISRPMCFTSSGWMATINGAHVAGVEDRTGSLTPGKRADIVVIDATAINVTPVHDPVAAVVLCADVSNVEHVLVDGEFRKRDFRLAGDIANARSLVEASRDRLLGAAADAAKAPTA